MPSITGLLSAVLMLAAMPQQLNSQYYAPGNVAVMLHLTCLLNYILNATIYHFVS